MTASQMHVLAFDIHYPVYHKPSINALFSFLDTNKVDGFVFGGDQLDLNEVSHHTKGKSIHRERGALKRNLNGLDKHILTPIEKRLKRDCQKVWIMGNHERFLQDLIDEQPELDGMLDIAEFLRLEDRGWKVVPLGGHHKLGRLTVVHGEIINGHGANVAKGGVEAWCSSIAFGHHHTNQVFTKVGPAHEGRKWSGTAIPCLTTTNPGYARNKANRAVNGFGIVEVRPNRDFNVYSAVIADGQFAFGGKIYGAKAV